MTNKKRSRSSGRWLERDRKDAYTQKAKDQGFRSRASFKLLEIQQKDAIIKEGMIVVDLGAAPGGWSQVAVQWVGKKGKVFALDILPMEPLPGVDIIQGDFQENDVVDQLKEVLQGRPIDLVISDMAPNLTGISSIDQPRSLVLAELALDFALSALRDGGDFLVKLFQGQGVDEYVKVLRQHFNKVITRKPKASRNESREIYLLARQLGKRGISLE